jgi:hypothetical protein
MTEETKFEGETKPFADIRSKVEDIVDSFINKTFRERSYDARQAQKWANTASEEIIKRV